MPIIPDSLPNAYEVEEITRMADVAGLPPRDSPSAVVTIPDSQPSNENFMRGVKAYKMLQELWGCDQPGHDLCLQGGEYVGHIQLSEEQISIWIGEICRGQATCHYPPEVFIIPDGSISNEDPNFDWGSSETDTDTELEGGPGYLCGLALERIGRTILYHSKVSLFLAKLLLYKQAVDNGRLFGATRQLYKPVPEQRLGVILQETADLMRPSYPLYIRKRATNIFGLRYNVPDGYTGCNRIRVILEWLGCAFRHSEEDHVSPQIMSALYRNLTSGPLHIHYDEVVSNFILILARYLTGAWERDYDSLPYMLTQHIQNVYLLRELSFKELNATHDYLESWLQQHHIPIHPRQGDTLDCLASTIKIITSLIAASPNPAFSCEEIKAKNVVSAFVDFFSHFGALDLRDHPDDLRQFSSLKKNRTHSFLLLIANPFTGPYVLSNSYCISILEDNGWVGNALSTPNYANISSPHLPPAL
ncbi:hypothetical protein BU17DRAFT_94651 [Hysterangium stoloniferum]|nr:hypothetical protein BU17DRAFT_94651 [Hysterangium stoloniferum]